MNYQTCTISVYLESKKSLLEKINAIDALIDTMIAKTADVAGGQGSIINEYWMDDGQMKVKTVYRSIAEVEAGITALEKIKQRYVNRFDGRCMVLRDVRGLRY